MSRDPRWDADDTEWAYEALGELELWKKLAQARGRILAAYRTNATPPGRAIDDSLAAVTALKEAGKYQEWK